MNYLAASEAFFTNTLHSGYMLLNHRFNLTSLEGVGQLKVTNRTYTLCYFTSLIGTRQRARNHISRCKKYLMWAGNPNFERRFYNRVGDMGVVQI